MEYWHKTSYLKPKIIHIDNSPAVTGAYKALLSWCLSAPQFEHIWVLPQGSAVADEARKHFTVYTLPFREIRRSPRALIAYLPALWRNGKQLSQIIRREQPGLLHVNDLYNLVPYIARKIGRHTIPIVVHARMLKRSFPAMIYNFWKQWHLKHADRIIAVSKAILNDWNGDKRVQVIYDPIAIREVLPPYRFQKLKEEPFRFLYLANYMDGKGQADALQAVKELKSRGITAFRVDFYGGTMGLEKNELYKRALEATIAVEGLTSLVSLNDAVRDVEPLMKSYHALLHFSHAESFGMVCFEALYYGLPVISSDCGGPAEMMESGISGILLPVHDITGYADAMAEWIREPASCADFSVEAVRFIRSRFSHTSQQALTNAFRQLMASYAQTGSASA